MRKNKNNNTRYVRVALVSRLRKKGVTHHEGRSVACLKNRELLELYNKVYDKDFIYSKELFKTLGWYKEPSKARPDVPTYVYLIGNADHEICKIGVSSSPEKRLPGIQAGCPYGLEILALKEGNRKLEKSLHRRFSRNRLYGEWFKLTDEIRFEFSI